MATLTPEAKQLLAKTIRELRARLLRDLRDEADRRYRLSLTLEKAGLAEEPRKKRARLDAWLDERVRTTSPKNAKESDAARARFLLQAQKEAAATVLNRMVLLRYLEALGLSRPAVVSGGWNSKGYKELRELAPALTGDETEGYATLLQLVFDELALDLPGLFGDVGLVRLFPLPAATLREVVEKLDDPALESAWKDDTTLGWVYQYWNDPEREALDAKIAGGGKIEPHEIASKTQMFTERYMVEWLLQNSLGLTWLSMCKKHGWTADAERVLPVLDARRADWRKRREAGEVALDALMPIEGELEEHWKYYVPQPIPDDAVAKAPESVRAIKLLDPACGSGHFLVIAFDLLAALYREEARHRGVSIGEREIAESILENNLHGIDIDPRAVQIAAAAVVLKAKRLARDARPKRVNLVAPVLRLGELPKDDPALVRLRSELKAEAGIPEELTQKVIGSLAGVDHLGSLLKVDAAIDEAIEAQIEAAKLTPSQGDLLSKSFAPQQAKIDWSTARVTLLERLEAFLARHTSEEDLGLRLDSEQLAAGVRFVRMVKEGTYDVVVGNPPYLDTSKSKDHAYVTNAYGRGGDNLYGVFMDRSNSLARSSGLSAMVVMRGWMFLQGFLPLRKHILDAHSLRLLADLGDGAFEQVGGEQVSVAMHIIRRSPDTHHELIGLQTNPVAGLGISRAESTAEVHGALLAQERRHDVPRRNLGDVEGDPIVHWWPDSFRELYRSTPKLGDAATVREGLGTRNDARFIRTSWEVPAESLWISRQFNSTPSLSKKWVPFIKGGAGFIWFEPLQYVVNWRFAGIEVGTSKKSKFGRGASLYFRKGIAFSTIGSSFSARIHRFSGIFGDAGSSVFAEATDSLVALMNSTRVRYVLSCLNPTVNFTNWDVQRIPLWSIQSDAEVLERLDESFGRCESTREGSVEFLSPGASDWRYVQEWAQRAVDREEGAPLPQYVREDDPPVPSAFVSFSVGVCLGRFGADGQGTCIVPPASSVPSGIMFVSAGSGYDSLETAGCAHLWLNWAKYGAAVVHELRADEERKSEIDLRSYLRLHFFKHQKSVYENRPIYFPLSSAKRSFVAWCSIHRWTSGTLSTLLADHLNPERRRLEGELEDLRKARATGDKATKAGAERRLSEVQKLLTELNDFIDKVTGCAERGPPPTTPTETPREQDARYEMDLDDGVMVNSAALWPLLEPQWKDPKKWWHELAEAKGRKDYDWAHLSKRYFPKRVEAKCVADPSLAGAHGCFWRLHPAKAYAWELRLQDEIRPDFTIDEEGSDAARARWLQDHAKEAEGARTTEKKRRERKAAKGEKDDSQEEMFGAAGDAEDEAGDDQGDEA